VSEALRLLLIEDNEDDAQLTILRLRQQGFELDWERVAGADALRIALARRPDAVIADYNVPELDIRDTIEAVLAADSDIPVIVVSGSMSAGVGVELMRLGAQDYLSKDRLERLGAALQKGLERARERRRMRAAETEYQSLFEQLPVGVVRHLPSGETVQVNTAMLRILGFPDEAAYRAHLTPFMEASERKLLTDRLAKDGAARGVELQVVRVDGSQRWVRMDLSITRGADGAVNSIDSVVTDIHERKQAEEALQNSHKVLEATLERLRRSNAIRQRLLVRLISAQEEERHRIALEIHDDAVQVMTAANIRLVMLGRKLADEKLTAEVDLLVGTVAHSTARLRRLMFDLQPPALEHHGLTAALRTSLEILTADTGIRHTLSGALRDEPPQERGVLVYRIVQEALTNVRKHSNASTVAVVLANRGLAVSVSITDDGIGFAGPGPAEGEEGGHLGLASMRERAYLAGGTWAIGSAPGAGTRVEFMVPFMSNVAAASAPA